MPRYEYRCDVCLYTVEIDLSIKDHEGHHQPCLVCGGEMHQVYVPILTCLPENKRSWGTHRYRRNETGERVARQKMPTNSPLLTRHQRKGGD